MLNTDKKSKLLIQFEDHKGMVTKVEVEYPHIDVSLDEYLEAYAGFLKALTFPIDALQHVRDED